MKYKQGLESIANHEKGTIRAVVAQDILDSLSDYGDAEGYLKDLFRGGCQSGMVSGLIYYYDTKQFFIQHMDEIDELRDEAEQNMGEPLKIGFPLYNWLAWFGYEETAHNIANELKMEL